ncbi:hypothetical protein RUR49_25080 [Pseudoxanthobacter sp. M-2]|uniref:hypothetical protein n=1 Tax=Pseudoxanthobacter sp. M-2 TaxID=3078754 RepID=UPI0038FCEB85
MLHRLRVLAVTACLVPLLAPSAMADFAIHCPTTTDGQSLRMAQHIAWAADKGGVVSPTKGCLFSEKIHFSVKGDIKDGETILV